VATSTGRTSEERLGAGVMAPTLGQWALHYATEMKLPVFPLEPRGKKPLTPRGFKDATVDPAQIERWWKANPEANIGAPVPPGYLVLDLDSQEAVTRLKYLDHQLPETAHAETSRGFHHWFTHPFPELRTRHGVLPSIDVKADGGYVVLPPSVHPSGARYRWIIPPWEGIAPAPEWLTELLAGNAPGNSRSHAAGNIPGGAPQRERVNVTEVFEGLTAGQRNSELFRYACRLHHKGLGMEEATVLIQEAAARCSPPLPAREAAALLMSAYRYETTGDRLETPEEVIEISQLMRIDFPPLSWIVPDLIAEGLWVLAASPKIGKSWFALNLALAVSCGGTFLGEYKTAIGEVLYIDLEQPPRRLQSRLRAMKGSWDAAVYFAPDWPPHDAGGFEKLDQWLGQHPGIRLVVIDVMAKILGAKKGYGNIYDIEYRIFSDLKRVADKYGVTLLAIHHDNKTLSEDTFDRISGSRALMAVADGALYLQRNRGQENAILKVTGREVEDQSLNLHFDRRLKAWFTGHPKTESLFDQVLAGKVETLPA